MVLYHDHNIVLYNPSEKPQFRSRRLSLDEDRTKDAGTEMANVFGRCPLCRQTVDARFAFVAQAYFDLLQRLHRSSAASSCTVESSDEVDVITECDLYKTLGVSRNAKPDDIKRAYRKHALRYHPDKNLDDPDAKLKFQKIAEAFSVLSDDFKRSKYDSSGDIDLDDFDMEQFINMVNAFGLKLQKSGDMDLEDIDADVAGEPCDDASRSNGIVGSEERRNPFLLNQAPSDVPVGNVIASEGGAEAEASAAAALRHLPAGLLNTGYYSRFFIETRELGSGSFGSVFLCRHVLDDLALGDYAVKKVAVGDDKAWLRDMIREVKTFERLHHPNIVEYKHSWLELSRSSLFCPFVPFLFILMQYCNGGSLDELIWHDGKPTRPKAALTLVQIWRFLFDILLGLQHLHRQGILHRDLKPTNILLQWPEGVTGRGNGNAAVPRALLSDFGTAAPLGETPEGISSRGYTGTVEYTAPELLRGDTREYSEKSDMWSLGIALYAMCFSSLPFSHDDPRILKAIIQRFAEERMNLNLLDRDAEVWLPPDPTGRLGSLRLVAAALLAFDVTRRPAATDLLENPSFRADAKRHARYDIGDLADHAALYDS